jgi:hypothetical protein
MPYWSATELVNFFPEAVPSEALVTGSSHPISLDDLSTIITMISAEFDSTAAMVGYLTPIPSSAGAAYDYARLIVGNGAKWQALQAIYVGDERIDDEYRVAYNRALDDIRSGNMRLAGAPSDPANIGRVLMKHRGIPSPAVIATWRP